MNTLIISPLELVDTTLTRYELPPEGISLLGYAVRRMHKTALLQPVGNLLATGQETEALLQVAHYAIAGAVSYGQLQYEPRRDHAGATVMERDPNTQAIVAATLANTEPELRFRYTVRLGDGSEFCAVETAEPSKISFRGWVMPVAYDVRFTTVDRAYEVQLKGTIIREIIPGFVGPWHIRAHGQLNLKDSAGNKGTLTLTRDATVNVEIKGMSAETAVSKSFPVTSS